MSTENARPNAPVDGIVIRRLRQAWLDMTNFGNHDEPCDNTAECEHCGSKLAGCSAHQATMQRRMAEMSDAIAAVVEKYGEDG